MKDNRNLSLSAAAVAITAAAAVTAAAAAAVGVVLHKISQFNALFEQEMKDFPMEFEDESALLEVEGEE